MYVPAIYNMELTHSLWWQRSFTIYISLSFEHNCPNCQISGPNGWKTLRIASCWRDQLPVEIPPVGDFKYSYEIFQDSFSVIFFCNFAISCTLSQVVEFNSSYAWEWGRYTNTLSMLHTYRGYMQCRYHARC